MSDRDRRRDRRRRRSPSNREVKPKQEFNLLQRPVLLTKSGQNNESKTDQPTYSTLVRSSTSDRSFTTSQSNETSSRQRTLVDVSDNAGSSAATPAKVQIQQKPAANPSDKKLNENLFDLKLSSPKEMKRAQKLIDDCMHWCDTAAEYLDNNSDYYVIGVIGLQTTGKSSILNYLATGKFERDDSLPFRVQTPEQLQNAEHCTVGVDIFVTNQRVILLDVQPILSASVLDRMIVFEKKYASEHANPENAHEIQSLQLTAFLFHVCHTLIFVQNCSIDAGLFGFIKTAEMLKPNLSQTYQPSEDDNNDRFDYFPHLVFAHTRCSTSDYRTTNVRAMQELISTAFDKSKLKYQGPCGLTQGGLITNFTTETTGQPVNMFLLPVLDRLPYDEIVKADLEDIRYKGYPSNHSVMADFRRQLLAMPRNSIIQNSILNEKQWFHHANKAWDIIRKSGLYMEYGRFMP